MKNLILVPATVLISACSATQEEVNALVQQNIIMLAEAHNKVVTCIVDNEKDFKKVSPCLVATPTPK